MVLSFAMWWLFDRSLGGIILGFLIAFSGTCIIHSLASNEVLTLTEPISNTFTLGYQELFSPGELLLGLSEDN